MGLNCSQTHLDTTHEATYTLECLLLKISTKYEFSAVLKHFAALCRCRTGRFDAMSGNMRVSPLLLSAWLHIKQAAWIRWGRDRNFRINGPPLHKSLHVIPETICIHLASRISWSVSHYYPIYGMITGFDNTVTIKRCKQVAVQYILHVWIKNKLDCA